MSLEGTLECATKLSIACDGHNYADCIHALMSMVSVIVEKNDRVKRRLIMEHVKEITQQIIDTHLLDSSIVVH